jgi:aminopeptidase 2
LLTSPLTYIFQYNVILNEFRTAPTSDERNDALRSLGNAKQPELVKRTLELPLSDEVKGQDIYLPLGSLRSRASSVDAVWDWMTTNWDEIVKRLPPGLGMLGTVVQMGTSGFTTMEHVAMIESFFQERSTKGFDQGLAQSLDSIKARAKWVERDAADVQQWLKANGYMS